MPTVEDGLGSPVDAAHVLHAMPDAALLVDDRDHITAANAAFVELLGLESDEGDLAGTDCSRVVQWLVDVLVESEALLTRIDPVDGDRRRAFRSRAYLEDGRALQIDYRPIEVGGAYRGCLWICREPGQLVTHAAGRADMTGVLRDGLQPAAVQKKAPAPEPPYRILIAEDDEALRMLLTMQLEGLGHHVTAVSNGDDAIAQMSRDDIDAVLLDVNMAGRKGPEVARFIRALPSPAAQVPIAALTATMDPGVKAQCFGAGMNDFLLKPVTSGQLQDVLARMLQPAPMRGDGPVREPASSAGVEASMLAAIATLEADLGHDPEPVARMVRAFLKGLPDLVRTIIEEPDAEVRRRACHRLSGSAHTFGAHSLGNLAATAEAMIVPGAAVMPTLADKLNRQASETSKVLESYLASGSTMRYPMPRTVAT